MALARVAATPCARRGREDASRARRVGARTRLARARATDGDGAEAGEEGARAREATVDALASVLGESRDGDASTTALEDVETVAPRGRSGGGVETRKAAETARASGTRGGRAREAAETVETAETAEKRMWREYLSLLVAVGGVKGTIAVCVATLARSSAFGDLGDLGGLAGEPGMDLATQAAIGLALTAPTALLDVLVMGVDWTKSAERESSKEGGEKRGLAAYYEPLSRYQQEETLNNPCRSMPAWMDLSVALTARVADEMLERAIVLGLFAKWLADRGVEAGLEPYEVAIPSKVAAVAGVYLLLELRLRRVRRQSRVQAFRVERNPVTGKQKLVPVSEEEMRGGGRDGGGPLAAVKGLFSAKDTKAKDGTKKKNPKAPNAAEARAFENILRGKSVKDFLDGGRSRLQFLAQSVAFVSTGSVIAPIIGGYAADALYILHQRNAMARFISRELGGDAPARSAGPPTAAVIKRAQTAAFANTLRRKKEKMGRDLVDAMKNDPSVSRDVNVMFQDVVRKTKSAKNLDEAGAVDDVLAFVTREGANFDAPDYAEKMRIALEKRALELAEGEKTPEAPVEDALATKLDDDDASS